MTRHRPPTLFLLALAGTLALAGCATGVSGAHGPSGPYVSGGAGYATH